MSKLPKPNPQYEFDVITDWIDTAAKSLSWYKKLKLDKVAKAVKGVQKVLPHQINNGFKSSSQHSGNKKQKTASSSNAPSSTLKRGKAASVLPSALSSTLSTPPTSVSTRSQSTRSSRTISPNHTASLASRPVSVASSVSSASASSPPRFNLTFADEDNSVLLHGSEEALSMMHYYTR